MHSVPTLHFHVVITWMPRIPRLLYLLALLAYPTKTAHTFLTRTDVFPLLVVVLLFVESPCVALSLIALIRCSLFAMLPHKLVLQDAPAIISALSSTIDFAKQVYALFKP